MKFTETAIAGAYLIDLERAEDHRGFFARAFSAREFAEKGLVTHYPEINFSSSIRKGTIRGLHYQKWPHQEDKVVRCVRGRLFDVMIDLRPDSPSFLKWAGIEISAESHQAIYVPAGCAHGVQTLEDDTEMLYMVSATYNPAAEAGICWNEPFFGVEWPDVGQRIVTDKDQSWPAFHPSVLSNP
jgi:dTDP-4-dehydrorhamnose 3,5-epimerase